MINWNVDPNIFTIFGKEIRWYGVLFAIGLVIFGPMIEERIWKKEHLPEKWIQKMAIYVFLCTVIGARLGHVLFYDPAYYFANPIKILAIHEGGLASHGGALGLLFGMWLYSRNVTHKGWLWGLDRLAVPVGLVAAMIRMGNLMNSEIFGRATTMPWGFRFLRSNEYWKFIVGQSSDVSQLIAKNGGISEMQKMHPDIYNQVINTLPAAHPTQIYEAIIYLVIFGLCMWLYFKRNITAKYNGMIVGIFLIGVFGSRFFVEMLKLVQEPWEIDLVNKIGLNMGQVLSIPLVILGIYFVYNAVTKAKEQLIK
ncbi:prolipoprotein diacylglyceryl transferase [Falsiporphyromonas endometrii]|uniref:Phosphatidylglycerol--prolipoprotein diacylglyceryl transferase n=1 Tax=Falsiporphyromonas endometrii TaxID=1387297 RepID=A0ABV9K8P1_9PORP|nr:prolipoprotein diacylglyceryl transferase [Porphyromonadaceae bacterium]